jgi:hypothetical protein
MVGCAASEHAESIETGRDGDESVSGDAAVALAGTKDAVIRRRDCSDVSSREYQ